ncbi:MAG: ABC transporter substrate-binding protein [Candidatus Rokubacteria bacterium]|nr:ABC transporter substrate-binding protein [Candidatus Rokubacteria bacterium]
MKTSRFVRALVVLVALGIGLGPGPAAAQDLVVGVAAPMTGNLAQIGKQFAEGAQLAADEVNARGGIKGRKVVVRVEDDKGDPKDAVSVAQKFASDDRVLAVLGHYSSSACFAAIPVYTKARLATITPSASHTELTTKGGKYMFRMWSPISVYAPDLAHYTVKKLGKKNVGVVYAFNDWGIQTKDFYVKELEKLGARVVVTEVVYDKDTDFKAQLTKVKAAGPDVLAVLTYYTTGALVVQQARNLGIAAPLVGTGTLYEDKFLEIAGKGNAEGLAINTEFNADDPAPVVKNFVAMYQKLHPGEKPEPYHATTYDAARIVLSAIEKAGTDRDAIRDAIAATRSFSGVTGTFSFNDNREREAKDQVYLVVKDGKWSFIGRQAY